MTAAAVAGERTRGDTGEMLRPARMILNTIIII